MKSVEVVSAVLDDVTGFVVVIKEVVNDDDSIEYGAHTFHPETLEWWAAVYEIDDVDELIDLVLHEPYVDNILPLQMDVEEALSAQRSKVQAFKRQHVKLTKLSRNEVAEALAASGLNEKFVTAAAEEPLAVIKGLCPFDPEVIAVKRQHIQRTRNNKVNVVPPASTGQERAQELRRQFSPRGAAKRPEGTTHKVGKLPPITLIGGKRKKSAE